MVCLVALLSKDTWEVSLFPSRYISSVDFVLCPLLAVNTSYQCWMICLINHRTRKGYLRVRALVLSSEPLNKLEKCCVLTIDLGAS